MSDKPKSLSEIDFTPAGGVFPSPVDWRDQFVYFLLVDRFSNGDKNIPAYDPDAAVNDRVDSDGEQWQGGTLKGITERLDYIKNLGCTVIWLSPIFRNRKGMNTYHGYAIQNFLDVDPRFGTIKDLQKLVQTAHKKGIYVVLDIVVNHTGDNWMYQGGYRYDYSNGERFPFDSWRMADPQKGIDWPEDAVWPLEFQNPEWYRRKGEIVHWDSFPEAREGDFCTLKELDTSKSEVLRALIDAYKFWIALADVDGYRLDAIKHVEDSNASIFCSAIREFAQKIGKKNFFLFGEIIGNDKLIDQYIGRNAKIPGSNERFPSLDAALDFPLWGVLEWVIKGLANLYELRARYDSFRDIYADHGQAGQYFVTFLDNHDQIGRNPRGRFLYNNTFTEQAMLAMGYLLTSLGIPCIYYGTEQGFNGGGDHDKYIRECMFGGKWGAFNTTGRHFFNPDNPFYRQITKFASLRQSEPALRYGRQYFREISGNGLDFGFPVDGRCTLAYSRILDDTEILIAMNLDAAPRNDFITVDARLTPAGKSMENLVKQDTAATVLIKGGRHAVRVNLGPHETAVLKLSVQD